MKNSNTPLTLTPHTHTDPSHYQKRILSVFGTRPEVIKMAPVVKALEASPHLQSFVCTTSQHRHMQDQMMALFGLKADFDLDIMKPGQSISYITAKVLEGLDALFAKEQFDLVLVHGDTTTSFAAALAAFNRGIPVGHVEAGLRTHNLQAPFPEEANRQLTGRIATWHFAPTELAKKNLLQEGVPGQSIVVTGNTVIDALFYMQEKIKAEPSLVEAILPLIAHTHHSPFVLITGHRRESFGQGFLNICQAIRTLSERFPDWHFVYPVHLNPQVQQPVNNILKDLPNVHLIEPVDYAPFVYLMSHCKIVLTDSGGVQEEAPALGKPVLVMREVTERPEGIEAGTAKLVGSNHDRIVECVSLLIENEDAYSGMANAVNPYGDGLAAQRITNHLDVAFRIL